MKTEDKIKRLIESEYMYIYTQMDGVQEMKLEFDNDKLNHAKLSHDGVAYPITTRVDNYNYFLISKENKMEKDDVNILGNYSPSGHNAASVVDVGGGSTYCDGKSWNSNCGEYP